MPEYHHQAIILAAGSGERLRPLTDDKPKCLVEVCGTPMILRMLNNLAKANVTVATIVCGYQSEVLREALGDEKYGIQLRYIVSDMYAETNSMYSLWLARGVLSSGALVLEGDAVCSPDLVEGLVARGASRSYWAGAQIDGVVDGSFVTARSDDNRIVEQVIDRTPQNVVDPNRYKSTGILSIDAEYGVAFASWLNDYVDAGDVGIYYDIVISRHLADREIFVHPIGKALWYEVDTVEDLEVVDGIFGSIS